MKKFLSILLAVLAAFLFACNKPSDVNPPDKGDNGKVIYKNDAIIENGKSDYKIVIDKDESDKVSFASQELQLFLEESTGVRLPIIDDEDVEYSKDSKYISIGNTVLTSGVNVPVSDLNYSGYAIKTVGKSVFIKGSSAHGSLQGVYAFLRKTLNYEFYAQDVYTIDKTSELKLPVFDYKHNPAIAIPQAAYLSQETDSAYTRRLGMLSKYDIWMMAGGSSEGWTHNTFLWVNPDKYNNENDKENYHPEWFSPDLKELCFTRDGGDNNDAMFQLILSEMKKLISESGDQVMLSLTQNDELAWCHCSKCTTEKNKYNSNLAIIIKYANRLIREIDKWKVEENINKEIKLGIFCYQETMDPPVVSDGNGGWKPVLEDVICEKNVLIEYAPLRMAMHSDFDSSYNSGFSLILDQLSAISENIGMWWYGTYFHTFLLPLNNFESVANTVQYFVEHNVSWSFQEGQGYTGSSSYEQLRLFILSKLYDDPYQNLDVLYDKFFENYYLDASTVMREQFESWRLLSTYNRDYLNMSGDVGAENLKSDYYPYAMVAKWAGLMDSAYKIIEKYQDIDPTLYQKLYDRICREDICIRYILSQLYSSYLSDSDLIAMRKKFKKDATRLGLVRNSGTSYLSDLYIQWGV